MRNIRLLIGLFISSIATIIITGLVLDYIGIERGSLLIKIIFIFLAVNVALYLLLLIFSVIRNIFRIYAEKRQKRIGSRFRTKIIFAFVGLTLIPSALLFLLSTQLINNSIDAWFSIEVQKPIYDSMDIARIFYFQEEQNVRNYAELLASNRELLDTSQSIIETKNFRSYLLKGADGTDIVMNAFDGATGTEIIPTEAGDIIRAVSPVKEGDRITGVVVVEKVIPSDVVSKMESIQKAHNEYNQIKMQQDPIRFFYFLMLTIATLLIVFLALWISLRIARSITVPIQSLAEATKTVAQGDLDFKIPLKRDDEIGMLIDSFNKMLTDLREGKRSLEQAYAESDRRRLSMEAILESINTGVIVFDRTGRIVTSNRAACAMLNMDHRNITGKSYKELLERLKSDELSSMVRRLGENGVGSVEKDVHLYIDGRPMDLRLYMTTLKDSTDNFIGTLVVFDNLTEIIMAQRALAWQEVAKRIAHEIKNPLTPIRLSAERLLKKWNEKADDFDDVLKRSTRTIVKEVNSLRLLVDEFSRFGKMPKMNLRLTNIRTVLEEVVELYHNVRKIEILTSIQETPHIEIDREQIKRALINLIDNAIQAKTEKLWINSYYNPSLDLIRIEVIDDGVGINEEDKDKLFFPYFSTKKDGTGLGLAIVNSIISKHRGYIRVQDNKPRGTQFIIELPVGK